MSLTRLVYVSTATALFQPKGIETLLYECRVNNQVNGVTGLLCFNHQYFLQYLEGNQQGIKHTFEKIKSDDRHENIRLILNEPINEPVFECWEMGYVLLSKDLREITDQYLHHHEFCPYSATSSELLKFIQDAKKLLVKL